MAPRIGIPGIDGPREARGRSHTGGAVACRREAFQLGELDDIRSEDANAVLSIFLCPVEGAVDQLEQLVALLCVLRCEGYAGADGDRADSAELEARDPVDDRLGGGQRLRRLVAGQEDSELVAAQAERLARLPQPRGDLRKHRIAHWMAKGVVDALEVVDVDQAKR